MNDPVLLTVYIRSDLNMRKGKMVAQAAHAAMRRVFDLCEKTPDGLVMDVEAFSVVNTFTRHPEVEVIWVASEAELLERLERNPWGLIIDHGHTEFAGQKTPTCGAIGIHSQQSLPHQAGESMFARQWLVFAEQFDSQGRKIKLGKEEAVVKACIALVAHLASCFEEEEGRYVLSYTRYPSMKDWVEGGYAKIALSAPQEDVEEAYCKAASLGARVSMHDGVMVMGPEPKDTGMILSAFKLI